MVTVSLIFGILMIAWLIALIGGSYNNWTAPWVMSSNVIQWILFACLGYRVFGALVQ